MTKPHRDRWYDDACATAHALDLVGERWALLVMRELMLGPKRFGDLRASLPGLSANVLTQRLASLEGAGILVRRKLPPPASVQVYELTQWGYQSEPIFQALGRWAARSPAHDPTLPLSAASLVLALRTMFEPERARDVAARIVLVLGVEGFLVEVKEGRLSSARSAGEPADVVLTGTPPTLGALIFGGCPLDVLEADGALTVAGDRALAAAFATWFPLPPKADAP